MIHLLWCTLRPQQFIEFHKKWISRCSNTENVTTHVLVSTESEKSYLEKYFTNISKTKNRIVVFKPDYIGVCLPSYKLSSTLECGDSDIVIFGSDDFLAPEGWDIYLNDQLGDKNGLLFVRDGYQAPDSSNMQYPAITIPIMTGESLKMMNNVIYHPSYHHMFSDCELYMTARDLGILIDNRKVDDTIFEHVHWVTGKRKADQADQSYNLKWKEDEMMWNSRKSLPVEKRIEVNI